MRIRVRIGGRVRGGVRSWDRVGGRGCGERGGQGEAADGMVVRFGHGGLELLEEEREALVGVVGGTPRGGLYGSETTEDGAEPVEGGIRAEAGQVGPD